MTRGADFPTVNLNAVRNPRFVSGTVGQTAGRGDVVTVTIPAGTFTTAAGDGGFFAFDLTASPLRPGDSVSAYVVDRAGRRSASDEMTVGMSDRSRSVSYAPGY